MKLPRDISGRELVRALERAYGYRKVHQQGSHVIMEANAPRRHRLSIPDHKALRVGTLNAVLRAVAAARAESKEEVLRTLFG